MSSLQQHVSRDDEVTADLAKAIANSEQGTPLQSSSEQLLDVIKWVFIAVYFLPVIKNVVNWKD